MQFAICHNAFLFWVDYILAFGVDGVNGSKNFNPLFLGSGPRCQDVGAKMTPWADIKNINVNFIHPGPLFGCVGIKGFGMVIANTCHEFLNSINLTYNRGFL